MAESTESGLGSQLERIEKKLGDMEAASRRNKITGRLISLAIAIVAVLMVWLMINPLIAAINKPEPYQDAVSEAFEQRLTPMVHEEAVVMIAELRQPYADAFQKVREEREAEVIAKLEEEANALINNVGGNIQKEMNEFQKDFEQHQLERLKREFPQLADPDKASDIAEKAATAVQNVVERLVVDLFSEHQQALVRLENGFNSVEVSEEVQRMSPEELEEHVSGLVFELLAVKLNEIRTGAAMAQSEAIEGGETADILPEQVQTEPEDGTSDNQE